jgi:hypothetical protein
MSSDSNIVMRKYLQKIVNQLLSTKKYSDLQKVDVFFTFGSPHKTAMCQWVYGIKIYSQKKFGRGSDTINDLQKDIRRSTDSVFQQSVCLTDIMFE